MKRDAGVNTVFFLSKKTAFTPASLFIFGRPTDVMALGEYYRFLKTELRKYFRMKGFSVLFFFCNKEDKEEGRVKKEAIILLGRSLCLPFFVFLLDAEKKREGKVNSSLAIILFMYV